MSALTDLQNSVQAQFAALSVREKRMVGGAAAAVAVFIVFLTIFSFSNKATSIRNRTAEKITKLDEVQTLASGYRDAKARQDALENQLRASNVRLVSYLEDKAKPAGIELPSINPKADIPLEGSKIVESSVDVTLTDVKLNRLLDFLQSVEAGPGIVKVKTLRMEPRPAQETVTAWITIATYKIK
ncbi:MAG: type II secretion system protein M [Archangium sp.]|nr:type II secretion system protein M [Archangium sp.]